MKSRKSLIVSFPFLHQSLCDTNDNFITSLVDTSQSGIFNVLSLFVLLKSQFDLNAAKMVQKVNLITRLLKSSPALSFFSLDKSFKHSTFGDRLMALIHLTSGLLSRRATQGCTNQAENRRHLRWLVKAADEKSLDCLSQTILFKLCEEKLFNLTKHYTHILCTNVPWEGQCCGGVKDLNYPRVQPRMSASHAVLQSNNECFSGGAYAVTFAVASQWV